MKFKAKTLSIVEVLLKGKDKAVLQNSLTVFAMEEKFLQCPIRNRIVLLTSLKNKYLGKQQYQCSSYLLLAKLQKETAH